MNKTTFVFDNRYEPTQYNNGLEVVNDTNGNAAKFYRDLFYDVLNTKYIHGNNDSDYFLMFNTRGLGEIHIRFQWSHTFMDWISNFDFWGKAYKNSDKTWYVHRGFKRVYNSIQDDIINTIESFLKEYPYANIIISGYSHGAAIAALCFEDMKFRYEKLNTFDENALDSAYRAIKGFGFGCPRFVFGILPKEVKKRFEGFQCIRNKRDLVTFVPPLSFLFHHAGSLVKFKTNRYKCNFIDAHRPENYMKTFFASPELQAEAKILCERGGFISGKEYPNHRTHRSEFDRTNYHGS